MRKFILTLLIFTSIYSIAQDGRMPKLIPGSKPILLSNFEQGEVTTSLLVTQKTNNTANTPTGNSTEVGTTSGNLSVSLNGASEYNIPIAVPPGINGVEPQISLEYNSQRGSGIAGFGWNIKGVSVISKIPSTNFHDGTISAVNFSNTDRYALDGQRLILKNPNDTYGGDGVVYELENFSNIKITSYGVYPYQTNSNYGPAYFKVEYPDGTIAQYGYPSQGNNNGTSTSITQWGITFWQNAQGNRINYTYNDNSNNIKITNITYGSINNNTPINSVVFNYTQKTRVDGFAVGGVVVSNDSTLTSIEVFSNTVRYKKYSLGYNTTDLNYTRLTSITEFNGLTSLSYNPTVFTYDDTTDTLSSNAATTSLSVGSINFANSANITGDFNGDGKMDFVLYPTTGPDAKKTFWLFDNLQGGLNMGWTAPIGAFEEIFPSTWLSWNNKLMPYQGITTVQNDTATIGNVNFNTYYDAPGVTFQNTKTVTFPTTIMTTYNNYCVGTNQVINIPKKYLSGDFNGDGITDVIAIEMQTQAYSCNCNGPNGCVPSTTTVPSSKKTYFIDLKRDVTPNFFNYSGLLPSNSSSAQFFVADFNGDGKSDMFVFDNGSLWIYSLNDLNQLVLIESSANINISGPILIGDYNGDGKADFMIPNGYGNSYRVCSSTGNNFDSYNLSLPVAYQANDAIYSHTLIPNDYNNDGKTDLTEVTSARYTFGSALLQYPMIAGDAYGYITVSNYPNIGNFVAGSTATIGKNSGPINHITNTGSPTIKQNPVPIFLSPNANNLNLSLSLISDNSVYNFNSSKDFTKETLLKTITNGNGVTQSITYSPIKEVSCTPYCSTLKAYTADASSSETYPNININLATNFSLVSNISMNGLNQDYGYYGAVSNTKGLGFLGFKAIAKTNFYNNVDIPLITTVSQYDTSLRGALVSDYVVPGIPTSFTSIPSNFISKNTYTYNTYDNINFDPVSPVLPNKVFKIRNTITESTNILEGTGQLVTTLFDIYNNVKTKTIQTKLGTTVQKTDLVAINYDDAPLATTDYHIGRIIDKTQTATVGTSVMTNKEQYAYGSGTQAGLLTQTIKFVDNDNSKTITETNGFDQYGNVISKTIAGSDGTTRTTSFLYDDTASNHYGGRFLTKSTDAEGLFVDYTYNPNTGWLTSVTNPQSTTAYPIYTNYTYDTWGKKTNVSNYLGTVLTNSITFTYTNSLMASGYYSIGQTGNDNSETKTFFDALDRPYISGQKNISGVWSYTQIGYDALSRKTKIYEPYFNTSTPPLASGSTLYSTIVYDGYGRVSQTADYKAKTTTYSYSGLTTSINDTFKTISTSKNATGTIASVTDPGGTINYDYYANNNMKTSTFGTNVVSVVQDGWGRKTQLTDPAAGTYSYTYNLLGETISETTPKGATNYTITPSTGKLTQKIVSGDLTNTLTTYLYDPNSHLLTYSKYTDTNGGYFTEYNYDYDNYKRPFRTTENNQTTTFFQHSILYDGFGRPQYENYNSQDYSNSKQSQKWVTHTYLNGYHWQILDGNSGTGPMLWQTQSVNERGQILTAFYGNSVGSETHTYDNYGYQTNVNYKTISPANTFLSLTTSFDQQKGNLNSRSYTSSNINTSQTFGYDSLNLDRLTSTTDPVLGTTTQNYDASGRIASNELGTYNYTKTTATPSIPYRNTSITADLTNTANTAYYTNYSNQVIAYNCFKKPVTINDSNMELIDFQYNEFMQRSTMFYGGVQPVKTQRPFRKSYSADGSMEITTQNPSGSNPTSTFVFYVGGDAYTAPLILKSDGTTQNYYYLHRDYQGSILAISNAAGQVVEKRMFDAWGQLIKYSDAAGNTSPVGGRMFIDRGYTGHEHILPTFDITGTLFTGYGLVNMNGRLYDPKIHRFLMPDGDIQNPYNTQNYNRYAYVLNNPLKYIDPSGEDGEDPTTLPFTFVFDTSSLSGLSFKDWDKLGIKNWSNQNFNIKSMSNSVSDGLKSVGNFITRNLESFGDNINDLIFGHHSAPPPPVIHTYQLNGPMPNSFGMDTGNYMSGGSQFYQEYGAINGEILNFNNTLLNRFKGSGIDPYDTYNGIYNQKNVNNHIKMLINNVKGLKEYYQLAGSPSISYMGYSSEGIRGKSPANTMEIYDGALFANYATASTIFHELTHFLGYGEEEAYNTEWRLADKSLRILNQNNFYYETPTPGYPGYGIWNNIYNFQGFSIPQYPYKH